MGARLTLAMKKTWWFALTTVLLSVVYEGVIGGVIGFGVFLTIAIFGWSYIAFFLVGDGVISLIRRARSKDSSTGFAIRSLGYVLWSLLQSILGFGVVFLVVG